MAADIAGVAPSGNLTTRQAAEFLNISELTLKTWRCRGTVQIPYWTLGNRQVRYRVADLDDFITQRMRAAANASKPSGR